MNRLLDAKIANPKLGNSSRVDWYDYYAGYSPDFVRDVLATASGENAMHVLDSWNGSGTTTATAAAAGHRVTGFDLNPALVVIAKGRHLAVESVRESIDPLRADILVGALQWASQRSPEDCAEDPLCAWFTPATTLRLRAVERAISALLVDEDEPTDSAAPIDAADLSPLAAFFYCALFVVVRKMTASFRTTNPTWVRIAQDNEQLLDISRSDVEALFRKSIRVLASRLTIEPETASNIALHVGPAENVNLEQPADLVLTSPPYCTRIDYVIATRPELAVLGHDADRITTLRGRMLGTPLTDSKERGIDGRWGKTAGSVLGKIAKHKSKAADTYYLRYYSRYFECLSRSIEAIDSCTKASGTIAMVVQDSFFKEVHVDLPSIVQEMGEVVGRSSIRRDFKVAVTKAAIHPRARAYRRSFDANEAVVFLGAKVN